MTPSNLDFLNDNLKYLGFGERSLLNRDLEVQIRRDPPAFELFTEAFYTSGTKVEARLYFTRSKQSDFYFFNKYDALLRYEGEADKDRAQTFYISTKGRGITFKEAFNLLQGRAVFKTLISKTGNQYQTWLQLDFTEKDSENRNYRYKYFRGGRYDLMKALEKHPIREMSYDNLRENLIRSLQRGNLHPVTFDNPDRPEKNLIEANPAMDTINIYPTATRASDGELVRDGKEAVEEEPHPAAGAKARS
jgi:hypothetical protein